MVNKNNDDNRENAAVDKDCCCSHVADSDFDEKTKEIRNLAVHCGPG
jgi:hypothetical protein